MLNFLGCSAQGIAVASGVTTLALLERMVERKILTRCGRASHSQQRHRLPGAARERSGRGGGCPPDARPDAAPVRRTG